MTTCEFVHDNNNAAGVYYVGQLVSGKFFLTVKKTQTVKAIIVTFYARSSASWATTRREFDFKPSPYSNEYYEKREILKTENYVLGSLNSNIKHDISPGIHEYKFELRLPENVPISFQGYYGHNLYEIQVTVQKPGLHINDNFKHPFTVIKPLDLNKEIPFREPINLTVEKKFLLSRSTTPHIIGSARIPYSSYAPGQNIPLWIRIQNDSTCNCSSTQLKMKQLVQYHIKASCYRDAKLKDSVVMCEKKLPKVPAKSTKEFRTTFKVPVYAPTSGKDEDIISITYYIKLISLVEGFHRNFIMKIPITIGTVPIWDSIYNPFNSPMQTIPNRDEIIRAYASNFAYKEDESSRRLGNKYVPKYVYYPYFEQSNFASNPQEQNQFVNPSDTENDPLIKVAPT